jgi:hypothetical protein
MALFWVVGSGLAVGITAVPTGIAARRYLARAITAAAGTGPADQLPERLPPRRASSTRARRGRDRGSRGHVPGKLGRQKHGRRSPAH